MLACWRERDYPWTWRLKLTEMYVLASITLDRWRSCSGDLLVFASPWHVSLIILYVVDDLEEMEWEIRDHVLAPFHIVCRWFSITLY
jgi:hypothetical protein